MKHDDAVLFRLLDPGDFKSLPERSRIAFRSHHDADGRFRTPLHFNVGGLPERCFHQRIGKTAFQTRENRLGFRITEPDVELQNFRPVLRDHDPRVNDAAVVQLLRPNALEKTLEDRLVDFTHQRVGHDRSRGIGTHSAGIGSPVAVQQALVILRGNQRNHRIAVGKRENRSLFPDKQLLDDNDVSGLAESSAETLLHSLFRFCKAGRHDHALSCRKTVGLDHHAAPRGIFRAHIIKRLSLLRETGVGRRRNAVPDHELLGKLLASLQTRSRLRRTEHGNSPGTNCIRNPLAERKFRPDNHQIDPVFRSEIRNRLHFPGRQGDAFGDLRDARIARRAKELRNLGTVFQSPADCVFAAAAAQNHDLHNTSSFRKKLKIILNMTCFPRICVSFYKGYAVIYAIIEKYPSYFARICQCSAI